MFFYLVLNNLFLGNQTDSFFLYRDGNISDIERAGSLHQYLCKLHKDYGNVAAFKYGQILVVSVANPKQFVPRLQICDIPGLFLYNNIR